MYSNNWQIMHNILVYCYNNLTIGAKFSCHSNAMLEQHFSYPNGEFEIHVNLYMTKIYLKYYVPSLPIHWDTKCTVGYCGMYTGLKLTSIFQLTKAIVISCLMSSNP